MYQSCNSPSLSVSSITVCMTYLANATSTVIAYMHVYTRYEAPRKINHSVLCRLQNQVLEHFVIPKRPVL